MVNRPSPSRSNDRALEARIAQVSVGLVAGAAFLGLALFGMMPRPGDTTLLVVFKPGTSENRMVELTVNAGARLVAFSRLPFAMWVHVEANQTIERLRAASLLVTHPNAYSGCAKPASKSIEASS